jgi:hypothetical protein
LFLLRFGILVGVAQCYLLCGSFLRSDTIDQYSFRRRCLGVDFCSSGWQFCIDWGSRPAENETMGVGAVPIGIKIHGSERVELPAELLHCREVIA